MRAFWTWAGSKRCYCKPWVSLLCSPQQPCPPAFPKQGRNIGAIGIVEKNMEPTINNRVYIYIWVSQVSGGSQEKNQARIEADRMDREAKRKTMQQRCGELFDELDANLGPQAFHPQHHYLPS